MNESPNLGRLTVELAGLRRRLASMLYEVLLLLGVLGLTFMVPLLIIGVVWNVTPPGWLEWLYIYIVLAGYFLWYWRRGGQTLAMQTWRLKLVDVDTGLEISRGKGLARYTLAWFSVLSLLGLLWALVDRDRQFLHDRLVGSRIVLMPPVKH
ncbi:MAG: RDD family protein [Rhodocyclaceae bacterium]|nr:RDD family protein [Rhodocyclaceae bacterium]